MRQSLVKRARSLETYQDFGSESQSKMSQSNGRTVARLKHTFDENSVGIKGRVVLVRLHDILYADYDQLGAGMKLAAYLPSRTTYHKRHYKDILAVTRNTHNKMPKVPIKGP
jgi:hypothetical protein